MTETSAQPQEQVAQLFMEHKGLGELAPVLVEKVEDQPCWYFDYLVDGARLELEVSWSEADGWDTTVTDFSYLERRR